MDLQGILESDGRHSQATSASQPEAPKLPSREPLAQATSQKYFKSLPLEGFCQGRNGVDSAPSRHGSVAYVLKPGSGWRWFVEAAKDSGPVCLRVVSVVLMKPFPQWPQAASSAQSSVLAQLVNHCPPTVAKTTGISRITV